MADLRYKWEKKYESYEEAMENAGWLHEPLVGNPDYKENRILLHVGDSGLVEIFEFAGSKTHIHVVEENEHPVLEMFGC